MNKKNILLFFLTIGLLSSAFWVQGQITILPEVPEGCTIKSDFSIGDIQFKSGDFIAASGPERYQDWNFICTLNTVYYVANWFFYIIVLVVVLMILYTGFVYVTSAGSPQKIQRGSKIITYVIIGLVVALFAKAVPSLIVFLTGTNETDLVFSGDYTLNISIDGSCQVTANPGRTVSGPGQFPLFYDTGANISLIVSDNNCSPFLGWSGSCSGNNNTCSINNIMDDHNISVSCPTQEFTLDGSFSGGGSGTIQIGEQDYSDTFQETFTCGQEVELSVTPAEESYFVEWTGDCSGRQCVLKMDNNKAVTANFEKVDPQEDSLVVLQVTGSGHGTITVQPQPNAVEKNGQSVNPETTWRYEGVSTSYSFLYGSKSQVTTVTLHAQADPGYIFNGWSGGLVGGVNCSQSDPCEIDLTYPAFYTVMAEFVENKSVLEVESYVDDQLQEGVQISTNGEPQEITTNATVVTESQDIDLVLEAPNKFSGGLFKQWDGCQSNDQEKCEIKVAIGESKKVIVHYSKDEFYNFTLDCQGPGSVEIKKDGSLVENMVCQTSNKTSFSRDFFAGSNLTLKAKWDQEGLVFSGWPDDMCDEVTDDQNQSICSLQIINGNKSGQVDFRYPLKVEIRGIGQVEVDNQPHEVDFEQHYLPGQDVTLLAQQHDLFTNEPNLFVSWEDCDSLSGDDEEVCQIEIDGPKTVRGVFLHGLGVSFQGGGSGWIIVEAGDRQFNHHSVDGSFVKFLEYDTNIVIQAIPDTGSSFGGWAKSGDECQGEKGDCEFVITNREHLLGAEFNI